MAPCSHFLLNELKCSLLLYLLMTFCDILNPSKKCFSWIRFRFANLNWKFPLEEITHLWIALPAHYQPSPMLCASQFNVDFYDDETYLFLTHLRFSKCSCSCFIIWPFQQPVTFYKAGRFYISREELDTLKLIYRKLMIVPALGFWNSYLLMPNLAF